jgi:hypothetical protein
MGGMGGRNEYRIELTPTFNKWGLHGCKCKAQRLKSNVILLVNELLYETTKYSNTRPNTYKKLNRQTVLCRSNSQVFLHYQVQFVVIATVCT